jgi:hypothetical protein
MIMNGNYVLLWKGLGIASLNVRNSCGVHEENHNISVEQLVIRAIFDPRTSRIQFYSITFTPACFRTTVAEQVFPLEVIGSLSLFSRRLAEW